MASAVTVDYRLLYNPSMPNPATWQLPGSYVKQKISEVGMLQTCI